MKNRILGYSAVASMVVILIMTVIENRQDDKQRSRLETTITDLRASDSIKGDSIKLLTSALQAQLESHCDTMTVEQRLKFLEFQKYEIQMWTEKEKDEMSAYQQKEKDEMSAYQQKEKESLKSYMTFSDSRYRAIKNFSQKTTEFTEYVITKFWCDHATGADEYKSWEQLEKVKKLPDVKEYLSIENKAYDLYGDANKKLDLEYAEKVKNLEKSYEAQRQQLEQKYDNLIAQKKKNLGL